RPKLDVADIPRRMGDLPKEFSEGTLKQALEQPENGAIAIAWSDQRKPLLLIKRRIEILGGSATLHDHASPFAQRCTAIADRVFAGWRERDPDRGANDPTRLGFASSAVLALAACGALAYAYKAHDAALRVRALQGGAFVLGVICSRLFVRGVRRWFAEQGAAW